MKIPLTNNTLYVTSLSIVCPKNANKIHRDFILVLIISITLW